MSQVAVNVEVERLSSDTISLIKLIELDDKHEKFASSVDEFLHSGSDYVHLFIIRLNQAVIGFFKLDVQYSKSHQFCTTKDLGLRTLAIDKRFQGQGLGFLSLKKLSSYLSDHYSEFQSVYLTVNHKNAAAISLYEKAGFEYTGENYLEGPAGPQHIMRKNILAK